MAGLLLVATSAGWAAFAFTSVGWYVGVTPTVLLVATVVAGRVAVVSGANNDERWRQLINDAERHAAKARTGGMRAVTPRSGSARVAPKPSREPRTATGSTRPREQAPPTTSLASGPVGRAVRPSDRVTDVFDVVGTDEPVRHTRREVSEPVRATELVADPGVRTDPVPDPGSRNARTDPVRPPDTGDNWDPVDVPPPAYTLKPAVVRPEPDPLPEQSDSLSLRLPEPDTTTSGNIDLDAVLERRRASGL